MPEYLYPGVYVEELDTGNKPIEGVSTSTVGFLGIAERGPLTPTLLTSFSEYQRTFGSYVKDADGTDHYLAYGVEGFFQNGGLRCFVQRVVHMDTVNPGNSAQPASGSAGGMSISAAGPGVWGNHIAYQISNAGLNDPSLFRLTVLYWTDPPPADLISNPTLTEVFDNLSATPSASTFYESEINGVSNLIAVKQTAGGRPANNPGAAVLNGAGIPIQLTLGSEGKSNIYVGATGGLAPATALTAGGTLTLTAGAATVTFTVNAAAVPPLATANDLITAISGDAVVGVKASLDGGGHLSIQDPAGRGNLVVSGTLAAAGAGNLGAFTPAQVKLSQADFQGNDIDPAHKTGLLALGDVDEISLLCCPDEYYFGPGNFAIAGMLKVQCETQKDRFAILQAPVNARPDQTNLPSVNSKYAAYYFPWLVVTNPNTGVDLLVPPGAHVAGIYARSDTLYGVQKDPANEVINGIAQLQLPINNQQQAILNPPGVNCLRYFKGSGNLVWGGRTTSTDPDWKYINVRRIFIFVETSIQRGTQWVVFEINADPTWRKVVRVIEDFLSSLWRDGMLQGATKEEAFFVKCDRTTMTQYDIDNGRLICVIGIAPVKPAEFVIFRIGQWYGGADVTEQ
ncbi:MAG TPA: phage tail sheath C-terminal domain-containing protein [Candidatus Solibacter sp.]|nr:phage tail sheath C-terminal domain-containing protein [Candidatus Solibacter sp.]